MRPSPRDENGWMIPGEGTKTRRIYNMMQHGAGLMAIVAQIGGNKFTVGHHMWRIRHPDRNKENHDRYRKPQGRHRPSLPRLKFLEKPFEEDQCQS
jgi:hypothetical protein